MVDGKMIDNYKIVIDLIKQKMKEIQVLNGLNSEDEVYYSSYGYLLRYDNTFRALNDLLLAVGEVYQN